MKRNEVQLVEYEMWKYRYIVLFTISLIISVFILSSSQLHNFLLKASYLSYPGALIIGFFYSYSISSPPAAAIFFVMSKSLNPLLLAVIGGFGGMLGDLVIFRFVKTELLPEARLLAKDLKIPRIKSHKAAHMIRQIAPYLAGFIIASPIPDELGAGLFGAVEYDIKKFLVISWLLHIVGILTIALLGKLF